MRRPLSTIHSRLDRLAEHVHRQRENTVDLEELLAILDEGRQRSRAGAEPPRLTNDLGLKHAEEY
jgi:hypothetical protein